MRVRELLAPQIEFLVDRLEAADLLTRRQAETYVLRGVVGVPRGETAERLGVSESRVDQGYRAAKDKIEAAQATIDLIDRAGVTVEVEAVHPDTDILAERLQIPEETAAEIARLYACAAEGEIRRALDHDDESLAVCDETDRGPVALRPLSQDNWDGLAEIIGAEVDASELVRATREAVDAVWVPCADHDADYFYRATVTVSLLESDTTAGDG